MPPAPLQPWDEIEEGAPDRRRVFTVRSDVVRSRASGRTITVDRLIAPDWVNVVAATPNGELVMVRQWRFGTSTFTLELPAGLIEPGEAALAAGVRELREETGFAGGEARVIGVVRPNPAFMGNRCTTIFVPDVKQVGEQSLNPSEEIEIVTMSFADVERAVDAGELSTGLGLVGLFWWLRDHARDKKAAR